MVISLKEKFYSKEAVMKSIEDFKAVTPIKCVSEDGSFIIHISKVEDVPNIEEEFVNYVLALTQTE